MLLILLINFSSASCFESPETSILLIFTFFIILELVELINAKTVEKIPNTKY